MLIFKHELPNEVGVDVVKMPYDSVEEARANIFHLDVQRGVPCMWFNHESNKTEKTFGLVVIGTGHNWGNLLKKEEYIGSLLVAGGTFVWHYFLVDHKEFMDRIEADTEELLDEGEEDIMEIGDTEELLDEGEEDIMEIGDTEEASEEES